ncbi:hypothetical protein ACR2R6_15810 [Methylocaldum gracile subsp. desertum]|uniref:hypothetical protein n=1 Tax=Methylocaldum sp. GT1BW TaxID=3438964 RepID=UPI003D9FF13C
MADDAVLHSLEIAAGDTGIPGQVAQTRREEIEFRQEVRVGGTGRGNPVGQPGVGAVGAVRHFDRWPDHLVDQRQQPAHSTTWKGFRVG